MCPFYSTYYKKLEGTFKLKSYGINGKLLK
jgi:hypothetical protein